MLFNYPAALPFGLARFVLVNQNISLLIFNLTKYVTYVTIITHEEFNYARKSSLPRERRKWEE